MDIKTAFLKAMVILKGISLERITEMVNEPIEKVECMMKIV